MLYVDTYICILKNYASSHFLLCKKTLQTSTCFRPLPNSDDFAIFATELTGPSADAK